MILLRLLFALDRRMLLFSVLFPLSALTLLFTFTLALSLPVAFAFMRTFTFAVLGTCRLE